MEKNVDNASDYYIQITKDGPYLAYGNPPIDQQIIRLNDEGGSWAYQQGEHYDNGNPTALCRCGASAKKPYCDGRHRTANWDPKETADRFPIMEQADVFEGITMNLLDNEKYCAFARFCDVGGRVWNLVKTAVTPAERELVKREVGHCPAGRLMLYDKESKQLYEPGFVPSIGLIQDPSIKVSGPIWLRGGIKVIGADGHKYEVRNRVTLCRCGQSENKPFCDGNHASSHFQDGLPMPETGHEW